MARITSFFLRMSLVTVLMFAYVSPALAQDDMGQCLPTISSLNECVKMHYYDTKEISNQGIYNSLVAKLDAAQAAQDHEQINVAINILNAFIHEVSAQSSKKITANAAEHMKIHAQMVIDKLKTM